MEKTEGNNFGCGFWFEFEDGYNGWALCMNVTRCKIEEEHGKLMKWIPA